MKILLDFVPPIADASSIILIVSGVIGIVGTVIGSIGSLLALKLNEMRLGQSKTQVDKKQKVTVIIESNGLRKTIEASPETITKFLQESGN